MISKSFPLKGYILPSIKTMITVKVFENFRSLKMDPRRKTTAAIISTIVASFVSSVCGSIGRKSQLNGKEMNFCIGAMSVFYAILIIIVQGRGENSKNVTSENMMWSFLNGFACFGVCCFFFYRVFDLLPFGDVYAINYSTTFIASIIAEKIKLNRKLPTLTCIAALISFSGLILFAQPLDTLNNFEAGTKKTLQGVAFAVLSGLARAASFLNIKLIKNIPPTYHFLAFSIGMFCASLPNLIVEKGSLSQCNFSARSVLMLAGTIWPFGT